MGLARSSRKPWHRGRENGSVDGFSPRCRRPQTREEARPRRRLPSPAQSHPPATKHPQAASPNPPSWFTPLGPLSKITSLPGCPSSLAFRGTRSLVTGRPPPPGCVLSEGWAPVCKVVAAERSQALCLGLGLALPVTALPSLSLPIYKMGSARSVPASRKCREIK